MNRDEMNRDENGLPHPFVLLSGSILLGIFMIAAAPTIISWGEDTPDGSIMVPFFGLLNVILAVGFMAAFFGTLMGLLGLIGLFFKDKDS